MSVGYSAGLGIAIPQLPHAPAARASIALTGTTLHSADISAPSLFVPIAGVSHPSSSIALCPSRPVSNIKGPRPCLARPTEGFPPAGLGDDVRKTITRSGASRSRQFQPRPASLAPDVAAHVRDESGALCAVSNDAAIAPSLQRHGTLISAGAPPSRKAAELKTLLGNANARLKPGAAVLPSGKVPQRLSRAKSERWVRKNADSVVLERAKSRARVEVDLALSGDTFVQGQLLSGQLTIRLRKCAKKEAPVLLSDAKLRIVGFESIPDEDHRHIFYQHSRRLEELSYASEQIFSDGPEDCDAEGYRQGREGVHSIHFEMDLPVNTAGGNAKGDVNLHGCVAIRYIVMISVKVKDADSSKRSLAHFYRSCSIWPQLSLQAILAPAPRPLVSTAAKSLFFSGKYNKLKLTARLSRLTYLAGQRCYVQIHIANDTRRAVRGVTLVLVRTTTVYIPRPDAGRDTSENAYQVNTIVREVAESRLELGERATKGHASAKGWWTGVDANEETEFFHFILLPPDALSIARSRLIAIDYTVRVTITASTGAPGFNSELSVILPVRIASMLSVDPPPSLCLPNEALTINRYCKTLEMPRYMRTNRVDDTRAGTLPPYRTQPPSLVDYEGSGDSSASEQPPYYTSRHLAASPGSYGRSDTENKAVRTGKFTVANPSPSPSTVASVDDRLRSTRCQASPTESSSQRPEDPEETDEMERILRDEKLARAPPGAGGVVELGDADSDGGREPGTGRRHGGSDTRRTSPTSLHRARTRALTIAGPLCSSARNATKPQGTSCSGTGDASFDTMPTTHHLCGDADICTPQRAPRPSRSDVDRRGRDKVPPGGSADAERGSAESAFAHRVREKLARACAAGEAEVADGDTTPLGSSNISNVDASKALPRLPDTYASTASIPEFETRSELHVVPALVTPPRAPSYPEPASLLHRPDDTEPAGAEEQVQEIPHTCLTYPDSPPRPAPTPALGDSPILRRRAQSEGPAPPPNRSHPPSCAASPRAGRPRPQISPRPRSLGPATALALSPRGAGVQMPRRPKPARAPGSVMDRVMMLEQRVQAVREEEESGSMQYK